MQYTKPLMLALLATVTVAGFSGITTSAAQARYTSGYMRQNGTYVQPHYSSDSNGSVTDNYSYRGNSNPYTGQSGTNSYSNSPRSQYYNPYGR